MKELHNIQYWVGLTVVLFIVFPLGKTEDSGIVPEGAASLAFVFDITGSMFDDLQQVIAGAARILATTLSRREKPLYNYVLVPFHDPLVGPVVVTTDPEDFQHELRNLYVQGGGDCPEMSVGAIRQAIDVSLPNSFIYVFTDARSKDFHLTDEVLELVQRKQSQVVFVLTGDCDDPDHEGYKAYEKIASTSSGQVFLLKKSQVNEVLNFVRVAVQSRKVNLMSVDVPEQGLQRYSIPIDSKLQHLTISVSGTDPEINLIDPSGNIVTRRMGLKRLLDIKTALVVNIKAPQPGQWTVEVNSNSPHTIRVTGLSTTDFVSRFSKKPPVDMTDTTHRPTAGIPTFTLVNASDLSEPGGFSRLELLDLTGRTISEFPLIRDPLRPNIYNLSSFEPPEEFFYILVSGVDERGYNIQRLTPTAINPVQPTKPTLYVPKNTLGYYGRVALLQCFVDSIIPYTVTWYRDDIQQGFEQHFIDSGNATLEIPNVNQFSEGSYKCNASNTAGSTVAFTYLDVTKPPPQIEVPQNASVLPGQDAMVTCVVSDTVPFNITWHRRGYRDRLRNSQKFTVFSNGSLIIRNVGRIDEGPYECRANNEGGQSIDVAYVKVQVPPIALITPREGNFKIGDTKTVVCKGKGYPEPEFYWLRAGLPMVVNENVRVRGGELTLRNMQRGDEGRYTCLVRNPVGESSDFVRFNYIEAPMITVHQSTVLVASGDEAVLFCEAEGIPAPVVHWYKGGIELKAVSYVQIRDDGELRIIGTKLQDAGEYSCEAVNTAGVDRATVTLNVGSGPNVVEAPTSQWVDIGGNATIRCRSEGLPPPKIMWQRQDGKHLDLGGQAQQLSDGTLFIQNVGLKDEGMYTCIAQNQFGTKETSALLTITGITPPILSYMDPVISVIQGETVELNCQVMLGNPVPMVTWLRDNQVLQQDEHVIKHHQGNVVITDVQEEHDGDFICLATNVGGNATFIVTVDVQVPPTFNTSVEDSNITDITIIEGDRVIIPCAVEGDPRPVITWFKDESPISLTDYHYFIHEDGNLEIYTADARDTGDYRCSASNRAGEIEKNVKLFVQVSPTIGGEPSESYTVIAGQSVVLPCDVNGVPTPEINWRKNFVNFEPEGSRYVFSDYGLTISDTVVMDKAIYECIATNEAGMMTKVITLTVHIPPVITSEGPTNIVLLKGEEVILGCENYGEPTPTLTWKKDELEMTLFNSALGYVIEGTGSLNIHHAKIEDTGRYVCIVENEAGIDTRDYSLTVQALPTIPTNLTTYKEVIQDNPVVLRCPAVGTPTPIITWYKDESPITGNMLGLIILDDGSLEIRGAGADDTATYKCVAENKAGKVEHEVDVKVLLRPELVGPDAGKTEVVDNPKVIINDTVTLTCPVEADPAPTITWLRNGLELLINQLDPRLNISEDGKRLTIDLSKVMDTARYTCIAENVAGRAQKNFDLDVQVPPILDEDSVSPDNNTVVIDSPLYLECPISGTPRPQIVWYKDDKVISPGLDPNIRTVSDGRRLEIFNSRVIDTGVYKCVGENVVGETEKEFNVDVHVPPKVDSPGVVERQEVIEDGTVSLTCPVSGIPLPEITWFRDNQPITENTTNLLLLDEGWTLQIVSATVEQKARYICRATNEAGEGKKAFDVHVLVSPSIDRENIDTNPKVIINQTTTINCLVDGIPAPEITWHKNGVQLTASIQQQRYEILPGGRQLRVNNAQLSDTAQYECLAVNQAGQDSVLFDLEVLVPSRISVPRSVNLNHKVVLNGSITLSCPATGVPPPTIQWLMNGEEILEQFPNILIQRNGQELVIQDAEVENAARYTCRVSNEAGDAELTQNVDVLVPPTIDLEGVNMAPSVVIDESTVLDCPAVGTPDPNIIWLKDGQPIDFEIAQSQFSIQANGKRLLLQGATEDDAGTYTCIAANEAGSIDQLYELDIWVPPTIAVDGLDKEPTVIKGHDTTLYCPTEGNPRPEINWLKDGEPLNVDDRVVIETGGLQLRINDARENDTGHYTCVVRNVAGQDSVSVYLAVHVPVSIDESNVVYQRKVVENRTVLIECPVSGVPPPMVNWLINGHPLLPNEGIQFSNNNYHLEILNAQSTDTAQYSCVATNAAGNLTKNFDLKILVPPSIDMTGVQKSIQVVKFSNVHLDCLVSGIEFPDILWLKDSVPLLDWDDYTNLRLLNNEQRLEITRATVENTGSYVCRATNVAGQAQVEFKVQVLVPPTIEDAEYLTPVPVIKGNSVTLTCAVSGIPEPQQTWVKDDNIIVLSENRHISIADSGQVLTIATTDIEDTGLYRCHAENLAGIAERRFEVEVQVPPTIEGSGQDKHVWVVINDPLTLDCPAHGVPPPRITWMRQGQAIQQFGNPSIRLEANSQRLLLVNAQLLDMGDYTCVVDNVAGNASLYYNVSVFIPPTIDDGPNKVQAVVNLGAILPCESLGLPDPNIIWIKDGEPFPSTGLRHRMLVSGTLEFDRVGLEDAGDYQCTAQNEAGNVSRQVQLDVQVPPRVLRRLPLYLNAIKGQGIMLPCNATGVPPPTFSWRKETRVIMETENIIPLDNGTLYLREVTSRDRGVYICMAQNDAGTDFGRIKLQILEPPKVQVRQTEFTVTHGQNIVLPCRARGRPRPKVKWQKDFTAITSSSRHLRILRQGLAIPFATPEDAGTYTCLASNAAGSDSVDIILNVQVPPQIGESVRLLTFNLGETAEISCNAIGIPLPTISWKKNGREINLQRSRKYSKSEFGSLIIQDVAETDTGSYTCTASNIAGRDTQNRLLRIQVPPSFIITPQMQEVISNRRLELQCTATGIPTPSIYWKHNELAIPFQPSVNGRSFFIIPNVRLEDSGMYTCVAQNPAGQVQAFVMVVVKVPADIIIPPGNKAVSIADTVTLECSVGGDPRPEVTWLKNSRPVQLSERIEQQDNGSLVIFASTSSDAGEYTCVATNDAGTSEGVAMLTIKEPPSFLIEAKDTVVDEGTTAFMNCVGFGEPTPVMSWMVGWTVLEDKGRLSIMPNNTLRIMRAQLSDSGSYRCLASNNLGSTFVEANLTVVVHGQWSGWSDWGVCSESCGRGSQVRSRSCDNPEPANDGRGCPGSPLESRTCIIRHCPIAGGWGNWLPWEQCSTTCDDGEQVRRRLCDNPRPQFDGEFCVGDSTETIECNLRPCAVDGNWGVWLPWQPCSATCGSGSQERLRRCDNPRPRNNGQSCMGEGSQRQPCLLQECAVDGNWGYWGDWTACSLSCGGGTRKRLRDCDSPAPEYSGLYCVGTDTQVDFCNNEPCPVHGNWASWGPWGQCSTSCNGGLQRRFRTCSNPAPSPLNGRACPGTSKDTNPCNPEPCPVDGVWSVWSDWSPCSQTCDAGSKERRRTCASPRHGGRNCLGDTVQVMDCSLEPCYRIPTRAEGNLVGFINSIDIPDATFTAEMFPLPDNTATHVTATLRNIPEQVSRHFRQLISVLTPVYWTTAKEIEGASNGFTLTDGDFTREVQVEYTTGDILKMSQYAKGVDRNGVLQLDIVVRGNVPDFPENKIVMVRPYWEDYLQTANGTVLAQSTRVLRVDGAMLPFAWNHSITYLAEDRKMPYLVQKLYARNMDVNINPTEQIVEYGLDVSIAPGTPSNRCPVGFFMDPAGPYCVDLDECNQNPCEHFCHNSPGSFACSCQFGFTLDIDGRSCIDVDECAVGTASCPGDQECTNTIGSYRCAKICSRGLRRSEGGHKCEDINECIESPDVCDQICHNRYGGYRCRCRDGYRKVSRGRCADIDECRRSPCTQTCENTPGSYVCGCNPGFDLTFGGNCRDINECVEGGSRCSPGEDCINTNGSYRCITLCLKGAARNEEGQCTDIDECSTGRNRCYYNQRCINTSPGYRCLCPRGYHSSGPGTPCLDIDECAEQPNICSYRCKNTYGDFECICAPGQVRLADGKSCAGLEFLEPGRVIDVSDSTGRSDRHRSRRAVYRRDRGDLERETLVREALGCPPGFQFDTQSDTCIDINECISDAGICQHNCSNTVGSYECSCPPGYRLASDGRTCDDIDECQEQKIDCKGADKMCFNTRGDVTCIDIPCPEKYQRDPLNNYCVLECIDAEVACPPQAKYSDVIQFRTLALPSGIVSYQDLLRLIAYNQRDEILRKTDFKILVNDPKIPFTIRLGDGIGVVYTLMPLEDQQVYRLKVRASSYDNQQENIQYQTTFIIHISVSAFPY